MQCRFDTFYFETAEWDHYKRIETATKMILSINNRQTAAERGLSVNKNLVQVNMAEAPIVAHRMVYHHIVSEDLQSKTLSTTKSVKAAKSRYDENRNSKMEDKILTEKEKKREPIQKDIFLVKNV